MSKHKRKGVSRREKVSLHSSDCAYHLCNDVGETSQCAYCKRNFCPTHLHPISPRVVNISTASYQELKDWNRKDTHPCMAYVDPYKKKQDGELNAAKEALDRMKHSKHSWKGGDSEESIGYWTKKLLQFILFPFIWAYSSIHVIFYFLIVKPIEWLYERSEEHTSELQSH